MEKLVTKGKYYDSLGHGGKLTYDKSVGKYTCYVNGSKIWTKDGNSKLYDDFTSGNFDHTAFYIGDTVDDYPIYKAYSDTVQKMCR